MDWDAIGAIGEIVGALAVVASLLYLGMQIRRQTRESRMAATREFSEATSSLNQILLLNPDIASLYLEGIDKGVGGLGDADALRFANFLSMVLRSWENLYYQREDGRLEDRLWRGMETQFSEIAGSLGFNQYWQQRCHYYGDQFRDYIDSVEKRPYRRITGDAT